MDLLTPEHFTQVAANFKNLPHQIQGLHQLHAAIATADASLLSNDAPWLHTFRTPTEPGPTGPSHTGGVAGGGAGAGAGGGAADIPGVELIREFEGCRLTSYLDSKGIPTIGWGSTHWEDGRPVTLGQSCTQEKADALLDGFLRQSILPALKQVPNWGGMSAKQQAALTSFAYNLGPRFYGDPDFSTITSCLRDHQWDKVPQAFALYIDPGTAESAGLLRRRQAEAAAWSAGLPHSSAPMAPAPTASAPTASAPTAPAQAQAVAHANPLKVPAFDQLLMDDGQGARDCFSASCAMLAAFAGEVKDENTYNHLRQHYGDSTDSAAQLATLKSLGLPAVFGQDGTKAKLIQMLDSGRPVAVGFLHHGPAAQASGGGHWVCAIGHDADHIIVNDPYGEADVVNGGYVSNHNGAGQRYSWANWLPRWMPHGSGGWYVVLHG